MNIKKIIGNLDDVMGDKFARSNWPITLGAECIYQLGGQSPLISFFKVTDDDLWNQSNFEKSLIIDLDSIEQINEIIEIHNCDIYNKENEGLMNANMTYLVSQGTIKFEDMNPMWSEQEELAYLYSKDCSGISKSRKYQLLSIE